MPLISMRQILDHAAENGYGVPAFNINDMEQVIAVLQAARKVNAPVIIISSAGIVSGTLLHPLNVYPSFSGAATGVTVAPKAYVSEAYSSPST